MYGRSGHPVTGETFVARHGASHLGAVGLADWAVVTEATYVARAVAAAFDIAGLRHLRAVLREWVLASPLCDQVGFARSLANALRAIAARHGSAAHGSTGGSG